MNPVLRRPALLVPLAVAATLLLGACAPEDDTVTTEPTVNTAASGDTASSGDAASGETASGETTATGDDCAVDNLNLIKPGTLTIGTDSPAYEPYFQNDDPTNGKGFESAVAYAVAKELGFTTSEVTWTKVPFNSSYAPGDKDFDFDINQISITPARAKVVDFSEGYYAAAQAVVLLKDSPFADASSLADLKDAKLGAQVGTTSLLAVQDQIQPTQAPFIYDDTNQAKQSLLNGQIDAIVVDLPTAFYITAAEISGSTIAGQFQPTTGPQEEFGMLFQKGNPLVACVNQALDSLKSSGRLEAIQKQWLSQDANVPELG